MKRVFLTVCSICLILAGLFGLFTGAAGIKDAKNLQDYKTEDSELGLEAVDMLLGGIEQLRANETTYSEGVSTYEAGLISYSEGQSTLSAGYAAYYEGKKALEEGKAEYEAGKKALAEGQAQIDANTQAYNEGKAQLAKIEPLLPYLNQYVQLRDGTIGKLPGFDSAQAWFVSVVRPLASRLGLDIPDDVTDFPAYINQMVADGKAQLKQYEDGLATLEAGRAKLAEAEKTIAAGEAQLAEAEKQLAQGEADLAAGGQALEEGKAQLAEFENGAAQIAAGIETLLSEEENVTGTYYFKEGSSGEVACPSIKAILHERYGEDWSYWLTDENGEIVVKNGCQYLDLDACEQAAIAAQDYINAYQGDPAITGDTIKRIFYCIGHPDGEITYTHLGHEITMPCDQCETVIREVIARYLVSIFELAVSVLSLICGIFGIVFSARRRGVSGMVLGFVTAGLGLVTAVFGFCTSFTSYIYPVALYSDGERTGYEFSSHAQAPALITLTVLAFIFALLAMAVKNAEKRKAAAVEAADGEDFDIPGPSPAQAESEQLVIEASALADEMTVKEE